jgi:peptidoglycan/xylan/chitin deacetylase (PgdA/CDA1 family)
VRRSFILAILWLLAVALIAAAPAAAKAAEQQRALRFGDRNEQVAALQRQLKDGRFEPGPVDGIFGKLTLAGVRRAQTKLALPVDGIAGTQTVAALRQYVTKRAAPAVSVMQPPATPLRMVRARRVESGVPEGGEPQPLAEVRRFALTFNGEPTPELLPRLLAVLKQNGMRATFFLRGETAVRTPEVAAQIVAEGHEIGSNGYADLDMTRITDEMRKAQLGMAQQAIAEAAGSAPVFFRPPGGRFNEALAQTARELRLSMVLWTNIGAPDLPDVAAAALAEQLTDSVHPGAVLMLHQDRANAVVALEQVLPALRADGYVSVGLSSLAPEAGSTAIDSGVVRN